MLYHIDVQWPKHIPTQWNDVPVIYSKHAESRCNEKGIRLQGRITGKAFECEYSEGRLTKLALRCKYSDSHDLCVVISNTGIVITAWLNHKQDNHKTLDTSRYVSRAS
jgi:hypothetical protein